MTKYVAKILIFRKIGKHHSQENLGKQIFGREIEFRRHRATTVQSGKEKSVEYVNKCEVIKKVFVILLQFCFFDFFIDNSVEK